MANIAHADLILEHLGACGLPNESLHAVRASLLQRQSAAPSTEHMQTRLEAVLEHALHGKLEVKVRSLSGDILAAVPATTGCKVSELKRVVEEKTSVACRQQMLVRGGAVIDDADTVASIGLGPFDAELSCVIVPADLYAIGGHDSEEPLRSVEKLDMRTKTWSWAPPMLLARHGFVATTVGNRIYVIGGAGEGYGSGEVFDPVEGEWSLLPPMQTPRRNFEMATIDRHLFVIGGYDGEILANGEVLDTESRQWSALPPMTSPRCDFGLACVNKKIYAMGGFDGNELVGSMEVLTSHTAAEWRRLPSMVEPRCYFTAAAIGTNVYAVGGQGLAGETRTLRDGEVFDTIREMWSSLPVMGVPRRYSASSVVNGKLYLLGGRNGTEFLTSCEVFDPEERRWRMLPEMAFPRRGCTHTTLGNGVYMLGGRDSTLAPIASAQAYDTSTSSWIDLPDMLVSRRGFAAAVA
mmetsp:Transcript_12261/g.28623  ORF Transcript_12261/g.28623 Transcript_12261/m.28623 type:complete len:465 (+) Transcript_12261:298-1692(+)